MLSKTMIVAAAVTLTLSNGLELTADNQISQRRSSSKGSSNRGSSGGGSRKNRNNTDDTDDNTTDDTTDNTPEPVEPVDPVEPVNPAVNTRQYFRSDDYQDQTRKQKMSDLWSILVPDSNTAQTPVDFYWADFPSIFT